MPHPFPSLAWMTAYADIVAGHPRAAEITSSLQGVYRFTITPGGGLDTHESYDLVVESTTVRAEVASGDPAVLAVTTDYGRWKGLLTGKADFVMSFLMRKIKVEGDLGAIRSRLRDARPLLDCLQQVPTTFRA